MNPAASLVHRHEDEPRRGSRAPRADRRRLSGRRPPLLHRLQGVSGRRIAARVGGADDAKRISDKITCLADFFRGNLACFRLSTIIWQNSSSPFAGSGRPIRKIEKSPTELRVWQIFLEGTSRVFAYVP